MPKILHIFDIMPFIHAGHVNKASKLEQLIQSGTTWSTQVTPTGGTSLIFNTLHKISPKDDCVFCSDRRPTIKMDMLPQYKNHRHHDNAIAVEQAAAEYILQECDCTVIARAGYEADDIIYTLVKKLHNTYDCIYIYTGDSDMYFLVDDIVSIKPSSTKAKEVTIHNYEQVLEKMGARYNTMAVQKIIKGDSSDNIPPLPRESQLALAKVLYIDEMYPRLGDKEFVKQWVSYILPEAINQVDLVFPLEVDDIPLDFSKPDKHLITNFGAAINNKYLRGCGTADFDIIPHVIELQSRGYYIEEDS